MNFGEQIENYLFRLHASSVDQLEDKFADFLESVINGSCGSFCKGVKDYFRELLVQNVVHSESKCKRGENKGPIKDTEKP